MHLCQHLREDKYLMDHLVLVRVHIVLAEASELG